MENEPPRPRANRPSGTPDPLPVLPLPTPEDTSELEGRWAVAYVFQSLALGGVLWRAGAQSSLRRPWVNLIAALGVGASAALAGTVGSRLGSALVTRIRWRTPTGQVRFWLRYVSTMAGGMFAFDAVAARLEGRTLWRGSANWAWVMGWPLLPFMLFINSTEVQAAGRLEAARRTRLSERTGLRNHYALDDDVLALRDAAAVYTFVYVDLDGFKGVNDSLGHDRGNAVLAEVGAALAALDGVAYHLHGDEFAYLLGGHDEALVEASARAAFDAIRTIGRSQGTDLGASFGACFARPNDDPNAVRRTADDQMRVAKQAGRRKLALSNRLVELAIPST